MEERAGSAPPATRTDVIPEQTHACGYRCQQTDPRPDPHPTDQDHQTPHGSLAVDIATRWAHGAPDNLPSTLVARALLAALARAGKAEQTLAVLTAEHRDVLFRAQAAEEERDAWRHIARAYGANTDYAAIRRATRQG